MDKHRKCIDRVDGELLKLFNERARAVAAIGERKRERGGEIYDPKREAQILRRLTRANRGPLDRRTVVHLFERIIDEFRSFERASSKRLKGRKRR
jgi:chorismate mutase-like protein